MPNPTTVSTDAVILAEDVNQYKKFLEGSSTYTATYALVSSTGTNFTITLGDASGTNKLVIKDSAGTTVASIDSDGNFTGAVNLAAGTLTFPTSASPAQTTDGQAIWDTDDNVITVGDGAATKQFGYLGTTVGLANGTASAGTSKEVSRVDHVHPGPTFKYMTAAQVITTTTTYADVAASSGSFAFAIGASEVWLAEFYIPLSFGGTGGAKFQLTGPSAPTGVNITGYATRGDNGISLGHATDIRFTAVTAFSSDIAAANSAVYNTSPSVYPNDQTAGIWIKARIINGSNAGTVTLQVAQNSSNSTTTLGVGSYMRAEKIA